MICYCEGGDELSSSIQCEGILDQLRNYKLPNKAAALWCLL